MMKRKETQFVFKGFYFTRNMQRKPAALLISKFNKYVGLIQKYLQLQEKIKSGLRSKSYIYIYIQHIYIYIYVY